MTLLSNLPFLSDVTGPSEGTPRTADVPKHTLLPDSFGEFFEGTENPGPTRDARSGEAVMQNDVPLAPHGPKGPGIAPLSVVDIPLPGPKPAPSAPTTPARGRSAPMVDPIRGLTPPQPTVGLPPQSETPSEPGMPVADPRPKPVTLRNMGAGNDADPDVDVLTRLAGPALVDQPDQPIASTFDAPVTARAPASSEPQEIPVPPPAPATPLPQTETPVPAPAATVALPVPIPAESTSRSTGALPAAAQDAPPRPVAWPETPDDPNTNAETSLAGQALAPAIPQPRVMAAGSGSESPQPRVLENRPTPAVTATPPGGPADRHDLEPPKLSHHADGEPAHRQTAAARNPITGATIAQTDLLRVTSSASSAPVPNATVQTPGENRPADGKLPTAELTPDPRRDAAVWKARPNDGPWPTATQSNPWPMPTPAPTPAAVQIAPQPLFQSGLPQPDIEAEQSLQPRIQSRRGPEQATSFSPAPVSVRAEAPDPLPFATQTVSTDIVSDPSSDTELSIVAGHDPVAATSSTLHTAPAVHRTDLPPQLMRMLAEVTVAHPDRPIEITLNPEELGKIRMTMTQGDGQISVAVLADRPETLDALRRHISTLGAEFQSLGYRDVSFSFGSGGSHGRETAPDVTPTNLRIEPDTPTPVQISVASSHLGGVDLRL